MNKILIFISIIFLLTSCFGTENKKNISENKIKVKKEVIVSFNNPKNNLEKEINNLEKKLSDDYYSKLRLVQSYLKYGNSYYSEKVFANKALKILNSINSDSKVDYLKGYAYEIQTKYDEALKQYNKVLAYKNLDKKEKINALNQKGHIFDLQGFLEKANEQYLLAEKLDPEYIKTLLNRGRYEARVGNNDKAEDYFNKIIGKTSDKFLKSELYYNLSIIYQGKKDGLDKAIDYAKKGIEANKDYPNNYLSLGTSYISKDGEFLDKAPEQLNKSIELYPNSSMSYKYLGIYYYIKDDFDKAIKNFKKQVETSQNDILLMKNDKDKVKVEGEYDLARAYALNSDVDNSIKYLKEVLNGENKNFYIGFLKDFSIKDGPFSKIISNKLFESEVTKIILKYNNK